MNEPFTYQYELLDDGDRPTPLIKFIEGKLHQLWKREIGGEEWREVEGQ